MDAAGKNSPLSLLRLSHAKSEIKKPLWPLLVVFCAEWRQVRPRDPASWEHGGGWWAEDDWRSCSLGTWCIINPLLLQVGRHHFGVGKLMH